MLIYLVNKSVAVISCPWGCCPPGGWPPNPLEAEVQDVRKADDTRAYVGAHGAANLFVACLQQSANEIRDSPQRLRGDQFAAVAEQ